MTAYLHRVTGYQQSPASSLADLLSGGESTRWMTQGACVPRDKWELFHRDPKVPFATFEARMVCGSCPVLDKCREWGIENHMDEGIIGGLDRRERTRAFRKQDVAPQPTHRIPLNLDAYTITEIRTIAALSYDGARHRIARIKARNVGRRDGEAIYEASPELLERSARALR